MCTVIELFLITLTFNYLIQIIHELIRFMNCYPLTPLYDPRIIGIDLPWEENMKKTKKKWRKGEKEKESPKAAKKRQ